MRTVLDKGTPHNSELQAYTEIGYHEPMTAGSSLHAKSQLTRPDSWFQMIATSLAYAC
tara:strand:- start:641 stop:814 length:174 start_codon:yes stop_codon:yes gene_type:complete